MSAHAAKSIAALPSDEPSHPLRRLWEELTGRTSVPKDVEKLSEHLLIDIGVDPRAVSHPAREAADTLQLLERGWQRPSRLDRL
jgi:hypothetical protein